MISTVRNMISGREYKATSDTTESSERMGPYEGQDNRLVVLIARDFVSNHPLPKSGNALTKGNISDLTADYYQIIQDDVLEFAIILVVLSNVLKTSV